MRKFLLVLILSGILIVFSTSFAKASFGISPADLTYENLLPGITVEKEFLLSRTNPDKEAEVAVETYIEGIESWIKVDQGNSFIIPKGKTTETMRVIISVPKDAELKSHNGELILKISEGGMTAGVSIIQGVSINAKLNVTGIEVYDLLVRNLRIPEVQGGDPIKLLLNIENKGNKTATLDSAGVIVMDNYGEILYKGEDASLDGIEPGRMKELTAFFDNQLGKGEYLASVSAVFRGKTIKEDQLVFSIKDKQEVVEDRFRVLNKSHGDWIFLFKLIGISFAPVLIIWSIIRRRYKF